MAHECRVVGLLRRPEYHQAVSVLKSLHELHNDELTTPTCQPMLEFQWSHWLKLMRKNIGGEAWSYNDAVAVYIDDQLLIGGLTELMHWGNDTFCYHDNQSLAEYEAVAIHAYNQHITNPQYDYVFMDVCVEGDLIGRLVMELDRYLCPRTTSNFISLCTGEHTSQITEDEDKAHRLSYVNSLIHRIVPGGWIQGGDICGGSGNDGMSIYGKTFEDESFAVCHSAPGVLGMANHGRNTNNSQFYITLSPASWMDRQYVAFGRVVEGSRVLEKIANLETTNERPRERCQISNCGRLSPITI